MSQAWAPRGLMPLLDRLTARDLAILEDLERLRVLTTMHVRRLHFTVGHATALAGTRGAVRVLGRLESQGLIARLERRVGGAARGSGATTWQLASTGERLLRARRGNPARRRYSDPTPGFLAHALAVSDLAVRLREAARDRAFDLLALDIEPASWRSFTTPAGGVTWIKPDLAVVTADALSETHAWIEVDRATEHLPAVLRKCGLYQRYFATGSEQAARGVFPAVVWSVPDARRAASITRAIAGEAALDPALFIVRPSADVLEVLVPPD